MIFFLLAYFIFLILFIGYSAAGIYHLLRFGYVGDLTRPVLWIYVAISVFIILLSLILIVQRNWTISLMSP